MKIEGMLVEEAESGRNSRGSHGYAVTISQNLIGMRGNMRCDGGGPHCPMNISFREACRKCIEAACFRRHLERSFCRSTEFLIR